MKSYRALSVRVAAATLAAGLLLVSCSSDSESEDGEDAIDDVQTEEQEEPDGEGSESESPEATPSGDGIGQSEIVLPDDVELVFDWETPQDPDEAAALEGAAEYMRSIAKGVVEQNPDDPTYQGYATGGAFDYARTQIELWVDGGWTMHGTDRFYDADAQKAEEGGAITVEFCHDDSEMLGKDAQTGEALPPEEYDGYEYLYHYAIIMVEPVADTDFWQAASVDVEEEATQCRE